MGVGDVGHLAGVGGGQRLAHGVGVRVLDGDEAGDRFVDVGRVAEGRVDLGRVERPVGPVLQRPDAGADDDRVTGRLVEDDVVLAAGDGLLAAPEVGHLGDEVAHRPGGDEQPGLLAEEVRGTLLERDDRRVVTEHVVAERRVRHRPAHRRGRVRDGVAAQVDAGHPSEYRSGRRRSGPATTTPGASAMLRPRRNWTRGVAAQHASLSRWRSPVRIRSGPPSAFPDAPSARPDGAYLCPGPPCPPLRRPIFAASVRLPPVTRRPIPIAIGLLLVAVVAVVAAGPFGLVGGAGPAASPTASASAAARATARTTTTPTSAPPGAGASGSPSPTAQPTPATPAADRRRADRAGHELPIDAHERHGQGRRCGPGRHEQPLRWARPRRRGGATRSSARSASPMPILPTSSRSPTNRPSPRTWPRTASGWPSCGRTRSGRRCAPWPGAARRCSASIGSRSSPTGR